MDTSFEEKSTWITLGSLIAIYGLYFLIAWQMIAAGVTTVIAFVPLFVLVVVLLVVVLVAGHVVAALMGGQDDADERDRLIEWRAESYSSWLLAVGVLTAIGCMAAQVGQVWVAHLLLGSLVASEILKHVIKLVFYRRGV